MYGAIIGDIVGSTHEFVNEKVDKGTFELLTVFNGYTDDTVMTIAVADALMSVSKDAPDEEIKAKVVEKMKLWGRRYFSVGYGPRFRKWISDSTSEPYGSYGNGSAMRVSPVGWLYNDFDQTRRIARLTAIVTHNHPEGIKGADAIASAIYLLRTTHSKGLIKDYISQNFGYNLDQSLDDIRNGDRHFVDCQHTVPEAIISFLNGYNFEDVIRNAVSLGGDTDTIAAIAGSLAEAMYPIPRYLFNEIRGNLPYEMYPVMEDFAVHRAMVNYMAGYSEAT